MSRDHEFMLTLNQAMPGAGRKSAQTRVKVARYRPGVRPSGVESDESESEESESDEEVEVPQPVSVEPVRRKFQAAEIIQAAPTPQSSEPQPQEVTQIESKFVDLSTLDVSALEVPKSESESDSDDDDERDRRRARLKAKLRAKSAAAASVAPVASSSSSTQQSSSARVGEQSEDEQEDDESSDEEYTDESESDDGYNYGPVRSLQKPVFVRKDKRLTIQERDRIEKEREELERFDKEEGLKMRRLAAREAMIEIVRREDEVKSDDDSMPDDDDDQDEEGEFDAWKLRELKRIKRNREERDKFEEEAMQNEARRKMTDAERAAESRQWERDNPEEAAKFKRKDKGKLKFMQRHHHGGAFFMDADSEVKKEVQKRDFTQATTVDKDIQDMSMLPKIMQVKGWGLKGRTKYTHLVDQDTTNLDNNPWHRARGQASKRPSGGDLDRPSLKKARMESARRREEADQDRSRRR